MHTPLVGNTGHGVPGGRGAIGWNSPVIDQLVLTTVVRFH